MPVKPQVSCYTHPGMSGHTAIQAYQRTLMAFGVHNIFQMRFISDKTFFSV